MSEEELLEFCELLCERLENITTTHKKIENELDTAHYCFSEVIEYIKNNRVDSEKIKSVNT